MRHGQSRAEARGGRASPARSRRILFFDKHSVEFKFHCLHLLAAEHFDYPRQSPGAIDRARRADAPVRRRFAHEAKPSAHQSPVPWASLSKCRAAASAPRLQRAAAPAFFFRSGYRSVRNASRNALARDGAEPAPLAMRRISGRSRIAATVDVLAHCNFLERVERSHELAGAQAQRSRDDRATRARDSGSSASHRSRWLCGSRRSAASSRISASISSAFMWNFAKRRPHRFDRASDLRVEPSLPFPRAVGDRFVHASVIDSASSREAAGVDAAFLGEHFDHRGSPRAGQPIVGEQLGQRENAEAIEGGSRGRGLIGMPAAARHQRLVEQAGLMVDENAQPQVVVLGRRSSIVEAAERAEEIGAHHRGGHADETGAQRIDENVAGALAMPQAGIHAATVANPNFVGLRNRAVRDSRA